MTDLTARIAVDPQTLRKAQILRGVRYGGHEQIGDLVRFLLDDAWEDAKQLGLVKEKMLEEKALNTKRVPA